MSILLNDFDTYKKISRDSILENTMSIVTQEYKYYTSIEGNYLAKEESVNKSFEILANKIAEGNKAIVMFKDDNRFVLVYNGFWDEHHQSIIIDFDDGQDESVKLNEIRRMIDIIKVFLIGFPINTYLIKDDSVISETIEKMLLTKIKKSQISNIDENEHLIKKCYFIENHLEKSKKMFFSISVAVTMLVVVNIFLGMAEDYFIKNNNKEVRTLEKNIIAISEQSVEQEEKNKILEGKVSNDKVWCN